MLPRQEIRRMVTGISRPPPPPAAPRVLFLTSGLGTGHTRAAAAVARALRTALPEARLHTVDFWSLLDASVARAAQQTYLRLVTTHPELYQSLYRLDQRSWRAVLQDHQPPPEEIQELGGLIAPLAAHNGGGDLNHSWFDRILYRELAMILSRPDSGESRLQGLRQLAVIRRCWTLLANRLGRRIRRYAPDAIVATQVNMAALAAHLKSRGKFTAPLIGVLTDYGVHDFWRQERIDVHCVAEEAMRTPLAAARVEVTGVPLMPEYAQPPAVDAARRRLGLPQDRPVLLVLGGGLGLGIAPVVRRLAGSAVVGASRATLVAVAGRNDRLRRELDGDGAIAGLAASGRLRIDGWVENLVAHMRAADLVIGKPGGLTTAEVLACGRPLFSTCSLRG